MHAWHGIGYILVGVVEEVEVDELLDLERLRGDVLDDLAAGMRLFVVMLFFLEEGELN
jgi:hypothetical protein